MSLFIAPVLPVMELFQIGGGVRKITIARKNARDSMLIFFMKMIECLSYILCDLKKNLTFQTMSDLRFSAKMTSKI